MAKIISEKERDFMREIFLMAQGCSSRDIQKVYISQGKEKDMPSRVTISKYINEFTKGIRLNTERDITTFNRIRKNNLLNFIGKNYNIIR